MATLLSVRLYQSDIYQPSGALMDSPAPRAARCGSRRLHAGRLAAFSRAGQASYCQKGVAVAAALPLPRRQAVLAGGVRPAASGSREAAAQAEPSVLEQRDSAESSCRGSCDSIQAPAPACCLRTRRPLRRPCPDCPPQVALPAVFVAPIRSDIVQTVHTHMAKNARQAYAVMAKAGHQTAAESWGTGRAVSRIPRVPGGGTHRAGEGGPPGCCRHRVEIACTVGMQLARWASACAKREPRLLASKAGAGEKQRIQHRRGRRAAGGLSSWLLRMRRRYAAPVDSA